MGYYAEEVAQWAVSLERKDIPQDVIDIGKHCLFDWTGISIYGSLSPWSQAIASIVKDEKGKEEASILVEGTKVPAPQAALVNGVRTLSYDLSDTFLETALHPSCGIISAALATAEREKNNGQDLLTAIIAGYEVAARVGYSLNKPPKRLTSSKGFEANALIPCFGATIAAGKLLRLNQEQMSNALGLCSCSMTAGLIEYLLDGNWTYRWNAGKAGHDGVLNALLAQKGFVGPHAVFEGQWDNKGRYGVVNAFTGSVDTAIEVIKDLSEKWYLKDIGFKYYGCCHYIHGFIDGILKLMKENQISPNDIEEITCFLPHMTLFLAVPRRIKVKPANLTVAQWSLPFCLATAILDGHLLHPAEQLSQEKLSDTRVLALSQRIQGVLREDLDTLVEEKHILQSPFKLKLKNGKEYEATTGCKGFPYNPLTQEETNLKFDTLVSRILDKKKTTNLRSMLEKTEAIKDISELARAMCR
ncbi:MAG: hypothetical protein COZ67_04320 [Chloroflexi bacterium CG_4_8_14_3_um_filter_45_15]|nr:MAG: hypothetical protein COZ67_04320 [Chloroflexi bacterium CG_4_8_14_3_um_filter_45_15]